MIDTLGAYLLVLVSASGAIAIQEMNSFDSCRAAVAQLEPIRIVSGYCIAKEIK